MPASCAWERRLEDVMSYAQANPAAATTAAPFNWGLYLYLLFMTSWFLHLPARLTFLGTIRFDLLMVCLLAAMALMKAGPRAGPPSEADKAIRVIIAYAVVKIGRAS